MQAEEYKRSGNELTDWDIAAYRSLVSTEITPRQQERVLVPPMVIEREDSVMGLHWHPEIVPLELIRQRVYTMYPNRRQELLIPTQHNELMSFDGFSGVEVDCYSPEFNRKVQLLLHFKNEAVENATVLRSMLTHTFKYRSSQFYELMKVFTDESNACLEEAAEESGADDETIGFTRMYAKKLMKLIEQYYSDTPEVSIKNKLFPNFISELDQFYDSHLISRALVLIRDVKVIVKKHFALDYFYTTSEIIEEVRALGGGIIVPHPEQFWPVLLADYDVDAYEVWNPQSREFTEFLVNVVVKKNKIRAYANRPLLITMGDDTHMGEKLKDERHQSREKSGREIGYQPGWDDVEIRKNLILGDFDKNKIITEYRNRLG